MKWLAVVVLALGLHLGAITCNECTGRCAERYERLVELSEESSSGVIELNSQLYNDLVKPSTRNYTIILMMNAVNPKHGCAPCRSGKLRLGMLINIALMVLDFAMFFAIA